MVITCMDAMNATHAGHPPNFQNQTWYNAGCGPSDVVAGEKGPAGRLFDPPVLPPAGNWWRCLRNKHAVDTNASPTTTTPEVHEE